MKAFITGSHAYGKPDEYSDIDLVILCDHRTLRLLKKNSDTGKVPIRYGDLNIIAVEDETEFLAWQLGTEMMRRDKTRPLNKKQAKKRFDKIRDKLGLIDNGGSG